MKKVYLAAALCAIIPFAAPAARADETVLVKITLKDHRFDPAEPTAPAGMPIAIEVTNLDNTPAEFESKPMRVEKTIAAGGKITVSVRALSPGRYLFVDEYHEATTVGYLVVK